jgi:hypothetical protein
MTIPDPTANELIDQAFLSSLVRGINSNTAKLSRSSVKIYDRGSSSTNSKQITSYLGYYTFATTQVEISHKLDTEKTTTESKSFSFGQTFQSPPLVFATVEAQVQPGSNTSVYAANHSVTIVNPSTTGATVWLTIAPHKNTGVNEYKISIFAIGLAQTAS